ncbi:MAG: helix-turn-helix domain-containing protein [Candidatus Binataceae bacterium]|jgi:excisionase family DNA binding protein
MKDQGSKRPGVTPIQPTILTVRELSEYLRVHPTTIYRLLHAKQIPGFRVGGEWRFGIDRIDRWLSEEAQAAGDPRRQKGKGLTSVLDSLGDRGAAPASRPRRGSAAAKPKVGKIEVDRKDAVKRGVKNKNPDV